MSEKPWGQLVGVRPSKLMQKLLDDGLDYEKAFKVLQSRHGISEEKFDLLWQVASVGRTVLQECSNPLLFSVYVGIPFCPTRCFYCSFPSHSLRELGELRTHYVEALLREIEMTARLTESLGMSAYTVYLGGGTPTSLEPHELERVLCALRHSLPGQWREFTVEAGRPDTLCDGHFELFSKHNVTRVSINPQTMHAATLQTIGRSHSPGQVKDAVAEARRRNVPVINMDVIVGLPGENAVMAEETMRQVLALSPENITVHVFSRKRASRFNTAKEKFSLPSSREVLAMHTAVTKQLESAYRPYYLYRQRDILGGLENIGYSLPGSECVYNIAMIEERHNIIGLGCGATSKFINSDLSLTNLSNPKGVRIYLERIEQLTAKRSKLLTHLFK